MRVLYDTNDILLMNSEGSLQFAGGETEAVEDHVLPHTVDPLPPGGQCAAHKVTPLTLAARETAYNLALHVHDDDGV